VSTPTPRPDASPAATTTTPWGTIRDALPAGFPVYRGAKPVEVDEPVSAAFSTDDAAGSVADALRAELQAAGYSTEAVSGPLEDGSSVIDSVGADPACRAQTTVSPTGTKTTITVLFGATCPWR
jgi:hypothetical protein